jgi:hypothetical protein
VNLFEWSRVRQPADAVDLRRPGALSSLLGTYGGASPQVLQAVLGQAFTLGTQTAVVEYRYLDPDCRNEHSRFYSTTFRRYPSAAHRLHFFTAPSPVPPARLPRLHGAAARARRAGRTHHAGLTARPHRPRHLLRP